MAEQDRDDFFAETKQFEELMMMYECAIKEVQTKLEILDREFSVRYRRNPISSIESRIKSPMSIYRKLHRDGLTVSVKNISRNLNDVAGIRIICNFIDDIYDIVRMVAKQDDLRVIETKDYIRLSEKWIDEEESPAAFGKGQRVLHPVFGEGTIEEADLERKAYLILFDGMETPRSISFRAKLREC